ncbi:hypothetical protein QIS99_09925 [Streptomyces sp. B-S-A8]|uniref:Uncharacterized protein n=1 Tax=Streptomyces solicavernae TaxID=3043614 RepID=A0ABT6RS13_9ACTN|nr:hypothetical protein [Streptomyces sp. B-S-A8]MDI3386528.1 hypothetical protein [Streptomyces sp. B-S-A8]
MTSPYQAFETHPRIEYRHFLLTDDSGYVEPPRGWAEDPRIAIPGRVGLILCSAGNDFFPLVRAELRDSAPTASAEAWDVVEETGLACEDTALGVREWDGGPSGSPLTLPAAGRYRVRIHCRGRGEAHARIGKKLFYEGVEEWLLQIWPDSDA